VKKTHHLEAMRVEKGRFEVGAQLVELKVLNQLLVDAGVAEVLPSLDVPVEVPAVVLLLAHVLGETFNQFRVAPKIVSHYEITR